MVWEKVWAPTGRKRAVVCTQVVDQWWAVGACSGDWQNGKEGGRGRMDNNGMYEHAQRRRRRRDLIDQN